VRWVSVTDSFDAYGFELVQLRVTSDEEWKFAFDGKRLFAGPPGVGSLSRLVPEIFPVAPGTHRATFSVRRRRSPQTADDRAGYRLERIGARAELSLGVMTFNVKGHRDGVRGRELGCTRRFLPCGLDAHAIAAQIAVRDARVVGLQEVGRRQAAQITGGLQELTGAPWQMRWARKHRRWGRGQDEGHAVLVREGLIVGSVSAQFSNAGASWRHASSRRIVQYAPVRFDADNILHVFVTHLSPGANARGLRQGQVRQLLAWTLNDGPAVLFGDFNASPHSAEHTYGAMHEGWDDVWLRAYPDATATTCNPEESCGFTSTIHTRADPNSRIDFIWAREVADVADVYVRRPGETYEPYRTLSDHMPVSAQVRFRS
jgi:endonuclease/exonuclease/phosphatase family metal-dependent hydrolase